MMTYLHIFAVRDSASKRDAARKFGIPLTTLIRRLRNPFPSPVGNPTAFAQDEEALFYGAGTCFPLYSCSSSFLRWGGPI